MATVSTIKPGKEKVMIDRPPQPQKPRQPIPKTLATVGLALVGLAVLAYVFRNQFVVATVNGKLITRQAYINAMEAQGGKEVLNQLILEKLVTDEAAKHNLTISQEEIDAQLSTIEQRLKTQGKDLASALAEEGMSQEDLVNQIKISQYITRLSSENVQVTDDEVNAYIKDNKEQLPKNLGKDELLAMVREQLSQSKKDEATKQWMDTLRSQADVVYW